jgi:hypothetical protein
MHLENASGERFEGDWGVGEMSPDRFQDRSLFI